MPLMAAVAFAALGAAVPGPSTHLDEHPVGALRLVAVGLKDGSRVAYLAHPGGPAWEVRAGQRLRDTHVETIGVDRAGFAGGAVKRLFDGGEPPAVAWGADYTAGPLSIAFDGDVTTLAVLFADYTGLNIILEEGTAGSVRIAARDAPWDGVLVRALESGGFIYRIDQDHVRIGRPERIASFQPMAARAWTGTPVTLILRRAIFEDLAAVFREVSGLAVEFPEGPFESVTVLLHDRPWDEALELLAASRKLTWRIDGRRLVITRGSGPR